MLELTTDLPNLDGFVKFAVEREAAEEGNRVSSAMRAGMDIPPALMATAVKTFQFDEQASFHREFELVAGRPLVPGTLVVVRVPQPVSDNTVVPVAGMNGRPGRVVAVGVVDPSSPCGISSASQPQQQSHAAVAFFDWLSGATVTVVVPTKHVFCIQKMFGENLAEGQGMVRSLYAVSLAAMTAMAARRCLVSLLLAWPTDVCFTMKTVSGEDNLVLLSKLILAGERQFSTDESADISAVASPLILGLRRQLSWLIAEELNPPGAHFYAVRSPWHCALPCCCFLLVLMWMC